MAADASRTRINTQGGGLWYFPPPIPLSPQSPASPYDTMAAANMQNAMAFHQPAPGYASPSQYQYPPFLYPGWSSAHHGMYAGHQPFYQQPYNPYLFGQQSTELVLRDAAAASPEPAPTSTALVRVAPTVRDTPSTYPCPPTVDPENPPVPIHPYLYQEDCPVSWDVRTNLRHNARRSGGVERLSAIALKAKAVSAAGTNHNTMRIIVSDASFPWTITVTRESGITVGDVFMEIGSGLDVEVTDAELVIAANHERMSTAETSRAANEGTGAVKTRGAGDVMRRVDWLGNKTNYGGLVHSSAEAYQALVRRKVHAHTLPNTWVLVLEEREEAEVA